MAQKSWNITDTQGNLYQIGMYHGDKSQHLLVYINANPILIEFNINKDYSFSFMIGAMLYDLIIIKQKGTEQFSYDLRLNQKYFDDIEKAKNDEKQTEILIGLVTFSIILMLFFIFRNLI